MSDFNYEGATKVLEEHLPILGGHPVESGLTTVAIIAAFLADNELFVKADLHHTGLPKNTPATNGWFERAVSDE